MRYIFAAAAAALMATPLLAETPEAKALREARNAEVVLSKYPARALKAGEQGPVFFKVKLARNGQPTSCEIMKSSGYPRLDEETCDLVLLHMVFKPVKDESGREISPTSEGVVNWKLPASAAQSAPPVHVAAAQLPEKKICKRSARTGSLVSVERTCMTKREWQRASDDSKEFWEELQGKKGSTNGQ
jgi:TonB family protein